MPRRPKLIAEQLRQAIAKAEAGGMSRYAIAKAAGVSERHLKGIAEGETTPRLDTAAKIAEAIGARITLESQG